MVDSKNKFLYSTTLALVLFVLLSLMAGMSFAQTSDAADDDDDSRDSTVSPVVVLCGGVLLPPVAPASRVSGFGSNLSDVVIIADFPRNPLPTELGGVKVKVKDSNGIARLAQLYFVSPFQIDYVMPPRTAPGTATVRVIRNNRTAARGTANVQLVAPGLFSANANGQGVAEGVAIHVANTGEIRVEPLARFDQQQARFVSNPIDVSNPQEKVFLSLSAVGVRFRSSLSAVTVNIGGEALSPTFVGPFISVGPFTEVPGKDQINVELPRRLAGRAEVQITVTVDGFVSNTVTMNFK